MFAYNTKDKIKLFRIIIKGCAFPFINSASPKNNKEELKGLNNNKNFWTLLSIPKLNSIK